MSELHVVSISGGKDSQATAILCLERHAEQDVRFVFADTGNEHPLTYEHLDYLQGRFNRPITRLRADFTADIARKRAFVLEHWPAHGVSKKRVQLAAAILQPTGNPFLDLCIWKGRFPSRKAQFCTQELKRRLLDAFMLQAITEGDFELDAVFSWQGVRRDESAQRKDAAELERVAEGWRIVRPIATWTAQQVVDFCVARNVALNPLYSKGMRRVGCMPCINCGKDELLEIANRFPEVIERIRLWESLVADASKRGAASFFTSGTKTDRGAREGRNIDERVIWARTARGGAQADLLRLIPSPECSSSYGLCEPAS